MVFAEKHWLSRTGFAERADAMLRRLRVFPVRGVWRKLEAGRILREPLALTSRRLRRSRPTNYFSLAC